MESSEQIGIEVRYGHLDGDVKWTSSKAKRSPLAPVPEPLFPPYHTTARRSLGVDVRLVLRPSYCRGKDGGRNMGEGTVA